jgi:hypothetical protein
MLGNGHGRDEKLLTNEGYSLGSDWIADHPREFALLAARKLSRHKFLCILGPRSVRNPLVFS